jgi:hypothetical protein
MIERLTLILPAIAAETIERVKQAISKLSDAEDAAFCEQQLDELLTARKLCSVLPKNIWETNRAGLKPAPTFSSTQLPWFDSNTLSG